MPQAPRTRRPRRAGQGSGRRNPRMASPRVCRHDLSLRAQGRSQKRLAQPYGRAPAIPPGRKLECSALPSQSAGLQGMLCAGHPAWLAVWRVRVSLPTPSRQLWPRTQQRAGHFFLGDAVPRHLSARPGHATASRRDASRRAGAGCAIDQPVLISLALMAGPRLRTRRKPTRREPLARPGTPPSEAGGCAWHPRPWPAVGGPVSGLLSRP